MAPKRPAPVENQPSASSSEEEEEETSSGEEEEVSDDEQSPPSPPQTQDKTTRTRKATPKKPEQPKQTVSAAANKYRSETAAAASPKSTAIKKSEDTKKQLFQRLWTEEDEIALLQGIIHFTAKKGYSPSKDMNGFLDFIKKSLHFDVSMSQLKDKILRSKKRFENQVKGKKGENKIFSKPHDQKWFDLSKNIWGSEGCSKASEKKNDNGDKNKRGKGGNANKLEVSEAGLDVNLEEEDRMEVEMERDVSKFYSCVDDYVGRNGLSFVHGRKKADMKENWRKLREAELELYVKRGKLMLEQAELMLSAFKAESADKD